MRGKATVVDVPAKSVGITPAYAGKSYQLLRMGYAVVDHPRVCGEKLDNTTSATINQGSPPRMRGKVRLILYNQCPCKDHPRVCGEKYGEFYTVVSGLGSPPRMRGKEGKYRGSQSGQGITPAYAGKRCKVFLLEILVQDHPRVCGEKVVVRESTAARPGSPPRMRGKEGTPLENLPKDRITPAYAGKSIRLTSKVVCRRDHPRVCGEKTKKIP